MHRSLSTGSGSPSRALKLAIALGTLLFLTLAAFQPADRNGFLNYDDDLYVTRNPSVGAGLTSQGIGWALTSFAAGNWHPLTWVSHMLDVEVHGLSPAGHHRTSVVLHLLNALLLFAALHLMTRTIGRSFLVATLFAVHPLHVESVAWVAERKDVLSAFFWILSILLYARYAARPSVARYLPVALAVAAGLLSKPMVVTLPFALLLLDVWPLQRLALRRGEGTTFRRLLLEKVPLFALVLATSVLTYRAQAHGGAISSSEGTTLIERVANAFIAYATYLWKMVWPRNLAVFYPYPPGGPSWILAGAGAAIVAGVSWLAWRHRERGWLLTGWLWYLGTLVPVIGLVRVGSQAYADRYTYIPLIGIFWIAAWLAADLAARRETLRRLCIGGAAALLILLTVVTRSQVGVWRSSVTLFQHALSATADNTLTRMNLGEALASAGRVEEAARHFQRAVELYPQNESAQNDLGLALATLGRLDEAIPHYREAVRLRSGFSEALYNLANALVQKGQISEAVATYRQAIEASPKEAKIHNNLGSALLLANDLDQAETELERAIALDPGQFRALYSLGNIAAQRGRSEDALDRYRAALKVNPSYAEVYNHMGIVLAGLQRTDEAAAAFRRALELRPNFEDARRNLARLGSPPEQ